MPSLLDLLKRISFPIDSDTNLPPPTLETLRVFHRFFQTSIPYENLSVFIDEPIRVDIDSVFQKLVERRRGGICIEM
jgi:N-hydroxyarylamine O-acetyltransferase